MDNTADNKRLLKKKLKTLRKFLWPVQRILFEIQRIFFQRKKIILNYNKAIDWIKKNTISGKGIIVSSKQKIPYPEVTGYLIPTLMDAGEYGLAEQYSDFLSDVQRPNGSFAGPDGREYIFDSGQALRGLVRASQKWDRFKPVAIKTADYIVSCIKENGQIPCIYGKEITECINVFLLPALLEAADFFGKPDYLAAAKKTLSYYKNVPDVLNKNRLTHFLAYIIDGFIDMGEADFVRPLAKEILSRQKANGKITAYPNVDWSCSTGVAQFAIIAYKLGLNKNGDKAIDYLCGIQNYSGGFFGSRGLFAKYFRNEEIPWANKFFIDAIHLKIKSSFNNDADTFSSDISINDGRFKAVIDYLGNVENKKILDVGCGKGRFAKKIKDFYPSCEMHGVDISEELLKEVPAPIIKNKGSILNLPYSENFFDCVFCVETLEHAIKIQKAIQEMCRVLKGNGKIIVIDKNIKKMGALKIADFEQWFDKNEVKDALKEYCNNVEVEEIGYQDNEADGLFLSWTGTKK
jgi:malonyl-CoA O-methyltransferase